MARARAMSVSGEVKFYSGATCMKLNSVRVGGGKQRQSVISIISYKLLKLLLSHSKHSSHTNNEIFIDPTQQSSFVCFKAREEGKEGSEAPECWVPSGIHSHQHPQQSRWPDY